jgi:hypothetical protein
MCLFTIGFSSAVYHEARMRLFSSVFVAAVLILVGVCAGRFVVPELEPDEAMDAIVRLSQRSRHLERRVRSLIDQLDTLERERRWSQAALSRDSLPLCRCESSERLDGEGHDGEGIDGTEVNPEDVSAKQHQPEPLGFATPIPHELSLPPIPHERQEATPALPAPESSLSDPRVETKKRPSESIMSRNTFAVAVVLIVAPAAVFLGLACLGRRRVRRRQRS